jgi:hypothetical protein
MSHSPFLQLFYQLMNTVLSTLNFSYYWVHAFKHFWYCKEKTMLWKLDHFTSSYHTFGGRALRGTCIQLELIKCLIWCIWVLSRADPRYVDVAGRIIFCDHAKRYSLNFFDLEEGWRNVSRAWAKLRIIFGEIFSCVETCVY